MEKIIELETRGWGQKKKVRFLIEISYDTNEKELVGVIKRNVADDSFRRPMDEKNGERVLDRVLEDVRHYGREGYLTDEQVDRITHSLCSYFENKVGRWSLV